MQEDPGTIRQELRIGRDDPTRLVGMPRHIDLTILRRCGIWRLWQMAKNTEGGLLANAIRRRLSNSHFEADVWILGVEPDSSLN